jgi:hypothetical protein
MKPDFPPPVACARPLPAPGAVLMLFAGGSRHIAASAGTRAAPHGTQCVQPHTDHRSAERRPVPA